MQRVKKFSLAEPSSTTSTEAPKSHPKHWAFSKEISLCLGIYYHLCADVWSGAIDKTKDVNVAWDMSFWIHFFLCQMYLCWTRQQKRYPLKWYSLSSSWLHPRFSNILLCCCLTDECYGGPMRTACMNPSPLSPDSKNMFLVCSRVQRRGQRCFLFFYFRSSDLELCVQCVLLAFATSAQLPPSLAMASIYSWSGFQAKPRHHLSY